MVWIKTELKKKKDTLVMITSQTLMTKLVIQTSFSTFKWAHMYSMNLQLKIIQVSNFFFRF